jgi:hypothetical protein
MVAARHGECPQDLLPVHSLSPKRSQHGLLPLVADVLGLGLRGRFCISDITGPYVALGALRDGLLTLTTLYSIVVSTASARADARGGKQDATRARLCEEDVVGGGDECLS